MHASHHALAKSLADAAQALGFDAMSALAAETAARMKRVDPTAATLAASLGATLAAGDFSAASFDASRHVAPGTINHLQPGDRLAFNTPDGFPLFTVEIHRKG